MRGLVFIFLMANASISLATDDDKSAVKRQSAIDYNDGGTFEPQSVEQGRPVRGPSSELPYSDDEIERNSPENYNTKNMPVDQD